jgi:DNA repair exonuclease SbcCD ATPase subunit
MARSGVTREQVFATADALVREGQNPTVLSVRTRLGGGSPNTITPLLSEWKALHEQSRASSVPAPPEPVEAVMRQVWGAAWQEAQAQLEGEREALASARKAIEQERAELLGEIERLDTELTAALDAVGQGRAALEAQRSAHERAESDAREARALAEEREKRIGAQDQALQELRGTIEGLRIEVARSEERAAHVDELRAVLKVLQAQQGRGADTAKAKTTPRRRPKPDE